MHQLPIEQQVLLVVQIVALANLCLRLWLTGLYRIYPYFFGYVVLDLLHAPIPIFVPLDSRLYVYAYIATEVLIAPVYVLVVLELYSKVLGDLTGLAGVARRYIHIALVVAIAIATLLLGMVKAPATFAQYFISFERTVLSSLVVFVLLISLLLVYYPIPLGRNVIAYLTGYAVYFLSKVGITLILSLGTPWVRQLRHPWARQLSNIDMAIAVLCFAFWIIALNREGEEKRVVVGHQRNPADQQRLRAQLEAINASLLRASGKW